MKRDELPVYTECLGGTKYFLKQRKPNSLEDALLHYVTPARTAIQDVCTKSKERFMDYHSKWSETSNSVINTIRDKPVLLSRFAFVASCGLGGWILGYKGGVPRKILYSSISGSVGLIICFPCATLSGVTRTWNKGLKLISEYRKSPNL
ncbi:unnamed protein product [Heterobilharzia americana]|nr:unnamed protein product [Heterobilharzia americana]